MKVLYKLAVNIVIIFIFSSSHATDYSVISGKIFDEDTKEPIGKVTVQLEGENHLTVSNDDGLFLLKAPKGNHTIKLSHIGYYSFKKQFESADSLWLGEIYLKTALINVGEVKVFERQYDPAQLIIAQAIARKKDILSQIKDYSNKASTRLTMRDPSNSDSTSIFMIVESQTISYWAYPDNYKEIILARKQSSNINADENMLGLGNILNFNKNRIELGQYNIVSPTAKDAMEYYNYYLIDTTYIDKQAVFVLEIEPKDPLDHLFQGTIHIADSTFDVIKVDVRPSEGVEIFLLDDLRYYQRFAKINNKYWMPIEIGFEGLVKFPMPIPGVPSTIDFDYVSSIYEYHVEDDKSKIEFDDIVLEVSKEADDIDSTEWLSKQMIPLTEVEEYAYQRIDSIENAPKPIGKRIVQYTYVGLLFGMFGIQYLPYDFFHYNRVEGFYLGLDNEFVSKSNKFKIGLGGGYSFKSKDWQYRTSVQLNLSEKQRTWLGVEYLDKNVRMDVISPEGLVNPAMAALTFGKDPFDYYYKKGFKVWLESKIMNHFSGNLSYNNYKNESLEKLSDRTWFGYDDSYDRGYTIDSLDGRDTLRFNPTINDGYNRTLKLELTYDSRKLIKNKGEYEISFENNYYTLTGGVEYSDNDFLSSDFDYKKYYAKFFVQKILDIGTFSASLYAGSSDKSVPYQNLYRYNYSDFAVYDYPIRFNTLNETSVVGDRSVALYINHSFKRNFFHKTGIPLVKKIPFSPSIHGGILWSDFKDESISSVSRYYLIAEKPYTELGFGLRHLTPFLSPINLGVWFTWQTSAHNTSKFHWNIGLSF